MVKIYYTFDNWNTYDFIKRILSTYYNIPNAEICKSNCGKPYIKKGVFFNATHSGKLLAVAVSDKEVGLDCEYLDEEKHKLALSRFSKNERSEILSSDDFYEHWTAKESFIKFIGSTLARDLKNVEFINGNIYFNGIKQALNVIRHVIDGYTIACVSEETEAEIIKI